MADEMGIACDLHPTCTAIHRLDVDAGLVEHELNRVCLGEFGGTPHPDPAEVSEWKWIDCETLRQLRRAEPSLLTPWFEVVLNELVQWMRAHEASLPSGIAAEAMAWNRGE